MRTPLQNTPEEQGPRRTPPYVPWTTIVGLIDKMKPGVPGKVDQTVLRHLPNGVQRQVRTALRFLGLINGDDATTPLLTHLVEARQAGPAQWQAAVRDLISVAYGPILGDLNLATATAGQLSDAFKANGVEAGEVREKTLRFFLAALKDSGLSYSPYLDQRGTKTFASRSGPRKPKPTRVDVVPVPLRPVVQNPTVANTVPVPEGFLVAPFPLRPDVVLKFPIPPDLTKEEVARITNWLSSYGN